MDATSKFARTKHTLPITAIKIGKRHRKHFGDVKTLAKSIDEIGLLHPVVIRPNGTLIAGERRLRAMKLLGWKQAPVTILNLDSVVRGELAENAVRKNFRPSELVLIARSLEPILRKEAKSRQGARTDIREIFHDVAMGKTRDKLGEHLGISGRTLEKMMEVVEAAETSPRKFGHLKEEMDETGKVNRPYRELCAIRDQRRISSLAPISGKFRTLIVDPPWNFDQDFVGRVGPNYSTMSQKELLALPVRRWAESNCHLYLWTPNAFLPQAVELLAHWGFEHKSILTWVKPKFGLGFYFRNSTEQVLFGVWGNLGTRSTRIATHFEAPVGKHSEKPERFYEIVRGASYPAFGEAFQRRSRPGFVNLFRERERLAG